MPPATVLLSTPRAPLAAGPAPGEPGWSGRGDDLRRSAVAAGFAVIDHALGTPPAVDFGPVAVAVIAVGEGGEAAVQTRRWRAELGDRALPILWVAPADTVAAGLDAGADVVLPRPVEPTAFAAQLRALARSQVLAARLTVRVNEARLLGDQLQKALAQLDREQDLVRRVRGALLPGSLPAVGGARFHVCHRPRGRGGDFYDVRRIDERHVGFVVGDAAGPVGGFVPHAVVMKEIGELGYRVVPPDEMLTAVNRRLLALGADDLPLVAALAGVLNAQTGAVSIARAGLPAPVHVPANGAASVWNVPGPFLGTADTTYPSLSGALGAGDRLLIGTDGTRPDGDPGPAGSEHLLEAATAHRGATGAEFADAVARELLRHVRHADDFTLLCVEMK